MVTREDNTYTFTAKNKQCKVVFGDVIRLQIDKKFINFTSIQEIIFFANKLIDVLDDYTGKEENENNNII